MKLFADLASLRRLTLSSAAVFFSLLTFSQNIAVGTWRTHFSYNNAQHLITTSDKIFCATAFGLFSREIETGTTRKLSKIDGLSDIGVSAISYNENANVLVIGYQSGFIDFIYEDEIIGISDIALSNLEGDKTINEIAFDNSNTYLATDLGVIVIRTSTAEIVENYVQIGSNGISVSVLDIEVKNDSLFVMTEEGIQSGMLSANLLDFSSWTMYLSTGSFTNLIQVGNELYALSGLDLFRFSSGWIDSGIDLPAGATRLFELNEVLASASSGTIYQLDNTGFSTILSTPAENINGVVELGGSIFIADDELGLVNPTGESLSPDGPLSDDFSNIRLLSNQLYGFHAPSPLTFEGDDQELSFSVFVDGQWENQTIQDFTNVSDVASYNGSLYFSSIGDGIYDELNETIISDIPNSSVQLDTVIASLASGSSLWISSFGNDNPIHLMDQDQNWTSFSSTFLGQDEYLTIDVSNLGIGWLGATTGLITVLDPEEVQADQISTSDGLPSSFIDVDISVEDNAWVATSRGPALFADASFIFFDSNGIRPTFDGRTLFEGEQINAVMTDGGNRIWFGTNSGLWVFDENTSEQVAVFTEANSPLPSDQIIQLEYNGSNGEVFILTARGMVSFRSSSSIGSRRHSNVNIFPNPVRPDYQGLVGLTGLTNNASVKVTDVKGNLVTELKANGGTASWNLKDVRGSNVNTGIYLFFSSDSAGEETYVGKIAVVR